MFITYPPSTLKTIAKEYLKYKNRISTEEFAKAFFMDAEKLEDAITQYLEEIKPVSDKFL